MSPEFEYVVTCQYCGKSFFISSRHECETRREKMKHQIACYVCAHRDLFVVVSTVCTGVVLVIIGFMIGSKK